MRAKVHIILSSFCYLSLERPVAQLAAARDLHLAYLEGKKDTWLGFVNFSFFLHFL